MKKLDISINILVEDVKLTADQLQILEELLSDKVTKFVQTYGTIVDMHTEVAERQEFTAVQQSEEDCYQLLDANGKDYCGEYITKEDAIRTSKGNVTFIKF